MVIQASCIEGAVPGLDWLRQEGGWGSRPGTTVSSEMCALLRHWSGDACAHLWCPALVLRIGWEPLQAGLGG